jgi:hypothetical protein
MAWNNIFVAHSKIIDPKKYFSNASFFEDVNNPRPEREWQLETSWSAGLAYWQGQ